MSTSPKRNRTEKTNERAVCASLFFGFLLFLGAQVPEQTANSDAIVYALRSLSPGPLLNTSFLVPTLDAYSPSSNYHVAHTVLFWLVYQLVPQSLQHSIWPGGLVSTLCLAVATVIGYRIWRHFEISISGATFAALLSGLLPAFWLNGVVAEVYAFQHATTLAFLLAFFTGRYVWSCFFFTLASLVSPLAGLAFALIALAPLSFDLVLRAFLVGAIALLAHLGIQLMLGNDSLAIFEAPNIGNTASSILAGPAKLIGLILLNLNLLCLTVVASFGQISSRERRLIGRGLIACMPLVLFSLGTGDLLKEHGTFLLPLLWVLCLPAGLSLAVLRKRGWMQIIVTLLVCAAVTIFGVLLPAQRDAKAYAVAGRWLSATVPDTVRVIGAWTGGVGATVERLGWNIDPLSTSLIHLSRPRTQQLLATGEDTLVILVRQPSALRIAVDTILPTSMHYRPYRPKETITTGSISQIYTNNAVRLYRWTRSQTALDDNQVESPRAAMASAAASSI